MVAIEQTPQASAASSNDVLVSVEAAECDASGGVVARMKTQYEEERYQASGAARRCKVADAIQAAVDDVLAEGLDVTAEMRGLATQRAYDLGSDSKSMQEQARRSLLADAAVKIAARKDREDGQRVSRVQIDIARCAALASGASDFQTMLERASTSLNRNNADKQSTYVVAITAYKKHGLEIELSCLTMSGSCFEVRVQRGTSVSQLAAHIQDLKSLNVLVKIIGPAGTLLEPSKVLPLGLDHETDVVGEDDADGKFYPLSVLTGSTDQAMWKKIGLEGPTRWRHLREKEFADLFGMSKASFETLPTWKQIPLKKKHDLF